MLHKLTTLLDIEGIIRTTSTVPKKIRPVVGTRSMIMENVSQMFASANQEKTSWNTLYYVVKR